MNINGVINKVNPRKSPIVINGANTRNVNGLRQFEYNKWRMNWNGNHFAPPSPDSILYLPGIPGFGSTIFDFSGQGNNGTITGATWVKNGKGLWALSFDGNDDLVTVTDAASIQNIWDGGGTFEVWVNPNSDGEGDAGRLLSKTSSSWRIIVVEEAGGLMKVRLLYTFSGDNLDTKTSSTCIPINTWSHLVFVYNADATANLPSVYIDDGSAVSFTVDATVSGTRDSDAGQNLTIGNLADGSGTWDGEMALLRLYKGFTMTQAQVTYNYNQERHLFGV